MKTREGCSVTLVIVLPVLVLLFGGMAIKILSYSQELDEAYIRNPQFLQLSNDSIAYFVQQKGIEGVDDKDLEGKTNISCDIRFSTVSLPELDMVMYAYCTGSFVVYQEVLIYFQCKLMPKASVEESDETQKKYDVDVESCTQYPEMLVRRAKLIIQEEAVDTSPPI